MFNDNYDILIEIIIDNKSLCNALFSKKNVIGKCLRIDVAFIKENLGKKDNENSPFSNRRTIGKRFNQVHLKKNY